MTHLPGDMACARAHARHVLQPVLLIAFLFAAPITFLHAEPPAPAQVRAVFRSDCETAILDAIGTAEQELLAAVYSFSSRRIAEALVAAANRGVTVKVKMDRVQSEREYASSVIEALRRSAVSLHTIGMPEHRSMHNKFIVVDGKRVLTGSFNFTVAASRHNWENLVVIDSPAIAAQFADEWKRLRSRKASDDR